MRQLFVFIRKEFYHVFRDRKTLLILFGLPTVQILLFGFALTSEVKNAKIVVVDYAKDVASTQIITKIASSSYFTLQQSVMSYEEMHDAFRKGKIKCAIVFPNGFNNELLHNN